MLSVLATGSASFSGILCPLLYLRLILHEPPVHPPSAGAAYDVRKPGCFMSSVGMDIPGERVADFNKWYGEEHIPLLSNVPGWNEEPCVGGNANLKLRVSGAHKPLTLHEWETPDAVSSEKYKAAILTPWTLEFKGIATKFEPRLLNI